MEEEKKQRLETLDVLADGGPAEEGSLAAVHVGGHGPSLARMNRRSAGRRRNGSRRRWHGSFERPVAELHCREVGLIGAAQRPSPSRARVRAVDALIAGRALAIGERRLEPEARARRVAFERNDFSRCTSVFDAILVLAHLYFTRFLTLHTCVLRDARAVVCR